MKITLVIACLLMMSCNAGIRGNVVCFGDSITHGAQVDGHSWVWFLSREHIGVDFINAGRNGRKTSDRNELLPVLKKHPGADYYLIFLGVNDLKNGTDSMVNNCVGNMKWMIEEIRATNSNAKIVILAPPDINLETMSEVNIRKKYNGHTKQALIMLEKRYDALAETENTGFISLLHAVAPSNYADGLHPDTAGQKQIAAAVWRGLSEL